MGKFGMAKIGRQMIKPYYQDEWVTIYHGDCREILPQLPRVDLVLTDPPYGMSFHSGMYVGYNPRDRIVGDDRYPSELVAIFKEIATKAVFMFCRWDNLAEVEKPKSFIAMIKNGGYIGDLKEEFGRLWEGILFYPCEQFEFNKRIPDVIDCRKVSHSEQIHPTQKPEYPIDILINNCSKQGDTILDPFLGSGTTAYCAKKLNRKCIGIEIEGKYCEISARRCSQGVFELNV